MYFLPVTFYLSGWDFTRCGIEWFIPPDTVVLGDALFRDTGKAFNPSATSYLTIVTRRQGNYTGPNTRRSVFN